MKYEIYPTYLRATMLQADANYWFLYEGTPGGTINNNDTVVRSDGTVTPLTTSWQVQNGLNASNTRTVGLLRQRSARTDTCTWSRTRRTPMPIPTT